MSNNSASIGGGLSSSYAGTISFTNCTISGNKATNGAPSAGGLNFNDAVVATLESCTISGNSAVSGVGGVFSRGETTNSTTVSNSIISGNTSENGAADVNYAFGTPQNTFHSGGYNLIGSGNGTSAFNQTSDTTGVSDPQLESLGNNGGLTPSRLPKNGSPALDAGSSSQNADQRGILRPQGAADDIGAVEVRLIDGPNFVVTTTDDTDNGNYAANDISLREAITFANANSDASAITFDATVFNSAKTISVGSSLPSLSANVTITGPTAGVTVDGVNQSLIIFNVSSGISVGFDGLTISNGSVGIFNRGTATINDCTLSDNAYGLYNFSTAQVTNSTATGNGNNTGIYNQSGTTNITNYTATGNGYGIANFSTTNLNNGTLSGNSLAGIFNNTGSTLNVNNSLIVGNPTAIQGTISSGTYNITTGTAAEAGLDPNGLQDNGGPTRTIALLPGSPAINAGDPAFDGSGKTDQRGTGFARVQKGRLDIGAYESAFVGLNAPTNLRATAANSRIILQWTDNTKGETGYKVERRSQFEKDYTQIYRGELPNQNSYIDYSARLGVNYTYRVRPYQKFVLQDGPYSNIARAIVTVDDLATPTGLKAALGANKTSVNLTWTDNAANETGYKVFRRVGMGDYVLIYLGTQTNQTQYTDTSVEIGQSYTYKVKAYVENRGGSDFSNEASVTVPSDNGLLPATHLQAVASGSGIALSWTDNATAEVGYKVFRRAEGGNQVQIFRGETPDQTSYTDSDVIAGTTYQYFVLPYKIGMNGDPSNVATATATVPSSVQAASSVKAPSGGSS